MSSNRRFFLRTEMMRNLTALTIAAIVLVSCGGGGGGSSSTPNTLPTPGGTVPASALPILPEVVSQNGVASLTLTAQFDPSGRPAFYYNGAEVAPTIRVQPGDAIHLHFINNLPEYCAVGVASNSNLHFHGLTSAPEAPGDDVITTNASPQGGAIDYVVQINTDQPAGLYWYHPHPHGISSWEVGNGMAGAIVVEGIANDVPQTAGLRERVIVLSDVPTDPSLAAGEDAVARRRTATFRLAAATRTIADSDETGACQANDTVPHVNGLTFATIGIRPGETELFRVINASGHRHFDLSFDGLPMTIVAQDGVPIDTYPGAPQTLTATDWVIPPAGRVEFLITGQKTPIAMVSQCYNAGVAGDNNPQAVLGTLADDTSWGTNSATVTARVRARSATAVVRSQFYRVPLPAPAAVRTIHFQEDANGFYLDGQQYDPAAAPAITAHSGTVEQWNLENDTDEVHDFHIHQVHFVVQSINGVAVQNPHWVDSFDLVPQGIGTSGQRHPSTTTVLIDFRDPVVRGIFLYHCHILDHEDGGMMAKIQVL
jgi:suppressor of ftsI